MAQNIIELREFLAETINQIIDGISDAQRHAKSEGAVINPSVTSSAHEIVSDERGVRNLRLVQKIEIDVAIETYTSDKGKVGIGVLSSVFGLGAQVQSEASGSKLHRIRFSVPVLLPEQSSILKKKNTKVTATTI